jgi:polyphosphate glucokinase
MATVLGIDIGGSGIKAAPIDVTKGDLLSKRKRYKTPQPAVPETMVDVVAKLVAHFKWEGPIGCTLPSVVEDGVVKSAANIDDSWIGVEGDKLLSDRLGQKVTLINDADAAGLAEMRLGAGRDAAGVVLLLTLGTGIGSALFNDGVLVPNTELGHLEFRGMDAEDYAAARLVERDEMRIDWWASRVNEYLRYVERILSPKLLIIGGGISKRFDDFVTFLETNAKVVPAAHRNNAGIIGAAVAAAERLA